MMTTATKNKAQPTAAKGRKIVPVKAPTKSVSRPANLQPSSGLGLAGIGDLASLLDTTTSGGGPIEIPLDRIRPDPDQPRKEFNHVTLLEMAETIKARKVKTPISVRPDPEADEGFYVINHGERRWRASNLAGKTTIPAFIDPDYTKADQVIENIQRDGLTPREIADFIGGELRKGIRKGEIAKAIGKSGAFVTQHVTLLDLPEPIADAFNTGRVNDVTVVNELVKAFQKSPDDVMSWLGDETQEISRGQAKLLRDFIDSKADGNKAGAGESSGGSGSLDDDHGDLGGAGAPPDKASNSPSSKKPQDPETLKKAIVQVMHDGRTGRLMLNRRPTADGLAWLKYDDDGHEFETSVQNVQLLGLLEA